MTKYVAADEYGLVGEGFRKRVVLKGEHYYLVVTETSVEITIPEENISKEQRELRQTLDELCVHVSAMMEQIN